MTDEGVVCPEWVPPIGLGELPPERSALIKGLFELAKFVAEHPELPVPDVEVLFRVRGYGFSTEPEYYAAAYALVDQVAEVLGCEPTDRLGSEHHLVEHQFGPVRVSSTAITPAAMDRHNALSSYSGSVHPAEPDEPVAVDGAGASAVPGGEGR